jgi:hypothetical protein
VGKTVFDFGRGFHNFKFDMPPDVTGYKIYRGSGDSAISNLITAIKQHPKYRPPKPKRRSKIVTVKLKRRIVLD